MTSIQKRKCKGQVNATSSDANILRTREISNIFLCFYIYIKFWTFFFKDDAQRLYISEITDCEKRTQINIQKSPLHKTLQQVTW